MRDSVAASTQGVDAARLGCFLSGGTDSSSVVGLLSQHLRGPANTFSIGFQEEAFNELQYAHIAAKHFAARHRETKIGAATAFATVQQVVDAYDEPFGNASVIPTYHCLRLAREAGMTTLLAGDGGDELFGGNERYRTDQFFQLYFRLPHIARKALESVLFRVPEFLPAVARARRYVNACNQGNPERYCAWLLPCRYSPERVLGEALSWGSGRDDGLAVVRQHYESVDAKSELNRLLYVDVKMTLGDNDLPKVSRAADMLGMRVRFPYLDRSLVDFSGSLPTNLKVRGLEKRYLFKKATANLLPKEILTKKKHGFGLPVGVWLKTDPQFRSLARDVLLDPRTYQRGYFRRPFVESLFQRLDADDGAYFGDGLWLFLMLELWHRRHMEGAAWV
jgi:asparagine synthase (glutamine-hydrolysing)